MASNATAPISSFFPVFTPFFFSLRFEEQGSGAPVNVAESESSGATYLVFLQVRIIPEIEAEQEVRQWIGEVGHLHTVKRHAGEFIVGKDTPCRHSKHPGMHGDSDNLVRVRQSKQRHSH